MNKPDIQSGDGNRTLFQSINGFRVLMEAIPYPVFVKDLRDGVIVQNQVAKKLFDLAQRSGRLLSLLDFGQNNPNLWVKREPISTFEELMLNGESISFHILQIPIFDEDGSRRGLLISCHDVTESVRLQKSLLQQNDVLEMIANREPLNQILRSIILDVEGQTDAVVSVLCKEGNTLVHCEAPNLPEAYIDAINGMSIGPTNGSCGTAAYSKAQIVSIDITTDPLWDDYRHIAAPHGFKACWSTPILGKEQEVLGTFALYYKHVHAPSYMEQEVIKIATHLSKLAIQQELAEQQIKHMAYYDLITDLPNRKFLNEELELKIKASESQDHTLAVMVLDLDDFKMVNDSIGNELGDVLIREIGNRIAHSLSREGFVARVDGDEFAILLSDASVEEACEEARKILDGFAVPFCVNGQDCFVTASIGICLSPYDGQEAGALIMHADAAMYEAKRKGGNRFQLYSSDFDYPASERLALLTDLRKAVNSSDFTLDYQPQFDVVNRELIGFEALIRWNHKEKGRIEPGTFITLAEDRGLIQKIGDWVLQEACRQWKEWRDLYQKEVLISINLSPQQLFEPGFANKVQEILSTYEMEPACLEIEVTENMMMNPDKVIKILQDLKQVGVKIAIDDFGTGYSSLSYLIALPFDRLKIDRSFIVNLLNDTKTRSIVKMLIDLGNNLNVQVIAEGVEEEEQLLFLSSHGCSQVQGFYTGHPVQPRLAAKMLI
ncbi:EAL domain-containing protein [Cohnella hongkongensis]|uniref:EAL domain-containing protein n=1 Tax=Cohnella hongkongensis TaxID=178337 RepID=A0ABV9FA66_9BACL